MSTLVRFMGPGQWASDEARKPPQWRPGTRAVTATALGRRAVFRNCALPGRCWVRGCQIGVALPAQVVSMGACLIQARVLARTAPHTVPDVLMYPAFHYNKLYRDASAFKFDDVARCVHPYAPHAVRSVASRTARGGTCTCLRAGFPPTPCV